MVPVDEVKRYSGVGQLSQSILTGFFDRFRNSVRRIVVEDVARVNDGIDIMFDGDIGRSDEPTDSV
jgi:hypothetical protein